MNKFMENTNKIFDKRLLICLISMILVLFKMYYFNNIFLILAVFIICVAIIMDTRENKSLYLLFMLPLIYVMKFENDQISLYNVLTIVYLLSMVGFYIRKKENLKVAPFVALLSIAVLTLINSLISDEINAFSSIGWFLNLIIFYFIMREINNVEIYKKHAYYFAISIAIVGICGIIFMMNTNIGTYLYKMRKTNTILTDGKLNYRYSGFDLDPNYFALQSLIAFWSFFIANKMDDKYNYCLLVILIIIGLATISKMYIITLIVSAIIYLTLNIKQIKKFSINKLLIAIGALIFLMSVSNKYILPVFESRIENIENVEQLTTGRSEIWIKYVKYILNNPKVLLIGNGIGTPYLDGTASHNTYILIVYRLGIIGTIIFISFLYSIIKKHKTKININNFMPLLVFMIASFALDIFDFDSFIYILVLILSMYKLNERENEVKNEN